MADIEARDPPISEPDTAAAADRDPSERTVTNRKAEPNVQDRKSHRFVGSTPFLVLVALAVAILVKTFLIQAFYIPSASMEPTLEIGDRVFVNKLAYDIGDLSRGDVIVFANPHPEQLPERGAVSALLHWLGEGIGLAQPADEDFIKRVIGLPGETIEIRDNIVYIDGEPLEEPYLTDAARRSNGEFPETRIPPGQLFMMGDSRGDSADSRYGLGLVPVDKVIGRAFIVIWPPSQFGGV
jgi:signal peptidase I